MYKRITSIPSRMLVEGMPHHMATNWWDAGFSGEDEGGGPCTPPTVDEFRARFPEFVDSSPEAIAIAIDDASCWADASWINGNSPTGCRNCKTAIAFLAAHYLTLGRIAASGLPDLGTVDPDTGVVIPGGQVTSLSFETMSVGFSPPRFGSSGSAGGSGNIGAGDWDLDVTPYGQRYLELLVANQPAVLVV